MIKRELLERFKKELENGFRPDDVSNQVALEELKVHVKEWLDDGYSPAYIAAVYSKKLEGKVLAKQISTLMGIEQQITRRKPAKRRRRAAAPKAPVPEPEKNGVENAPEPREEDGVEAVELDNVWQWREEDNAVTLKTPEPVKTGFRFKTPSGRIVEAVSCKPATYGSGFSRREGMEVFYRGV